MMQLDSMQQQFKKDPQSWFLYDQIPIEMWHEEIKKKESLFLFVPIAWYKHHLSSQHFDFGVENAECDLKKIVSIARELSKKVIFLFPLGPSPFMLRGGVPAWLESENIFLNKETIAQVILNTGKKNNLISFHHPKVYQEYRKFAWNLGEFLLNEKISEDVVGFSSGFIRDHKWVSYLEDYSVQSEKSFNLFLSRKGDLLFPLSFYRYEYEKMLSNLFLESAKECLLRNWAGDTRVAFLAGNPWEQVKKDERK
ncbi:MAG: hypothetical protein KBD63_03475, partial [Bacteriovoracaceae bacterium]|nr:hypothetical protein [Bacteriovoracaceae bacterium]